MNNGVWGEGWPERHREDEIKLNQYFRQLVENMPMKKTQSKRASSKPNLAVEARVQASYAQGFNNGLMEASNQKSIARVEWHDAGGCDVSPGLYFVENHNGNIMAAHFYETSYGAYDTRNEAGFVDSQGTSIQPHCIRRFYGPVDLPVSKING